MSARLRCFLTCAFLVLLGSPVQGAGWNHVGNVDQVRELKDGVELSAGQAKVRVTFFRGDIIRVRVAANGVFPKDISWAIIQPAEPPAIKVRDEEDEVRVASGAVVVVVKKSPLLINFENEKGKTILADEPSLPMAWNGQRVGVWKKMAQFENYYGLGDKPGALNRRNRAFTLWNTDSYAWQESTDPLYKTIPFFIGLNQGTAYGIFFDNTYRSNFNFGLESPDFYSFGSEGGEINYYYLAGPEPKKVVQMFASLTGHTQLPPYWTLGFQQSRYSYFPEVRVREIAKTFRDKKIPCDALYLDIDYQKGNAPFTVDRQRFPNFEQMIKDLAMQNFHTVLIVDLHVKSDPDHGYAPYDTGIKNDAFVKKADGSLYVGNVWPGESVFPDFTLSRVRTWWGGLFADFVNMGVSGFWNDMNEPALFLTSTKTMPLDNLHRLDDGTTLDHRAVHNFYGMENVRATYEGLRALRPTERPFVLTRAAYAGTQRYAATWTGDNISTWNHIRMSTPLMLNLGMSGYPMVGTDIGGFAGSPTPELLTRWLELGAFNPIYRDHTALGTADQEPWVHGPEYEAIRKRYIELRYSLLPYTYTAVEESFRAGIPLMRPIFLDYPQAAGFYGNERDFLFGDDFFVAPIVTEMVDLEEINLPPGAWYDFWTSTRFTEKDKIAIRPTLEVLPLYVRAGAIVPMQRVIQATNETPTGPLELRVYPGENCRGSLYQDDGHTYGYEKGEFLRVAYGCTVSPNGIRVSSHIEQNGRTPWWNTAEVKIYGVAASPKAVRLGDQPMTGWHYDSDAHAVNLTVPDAVRDWSVQIVQP
jgi:alpha-glucosidase